MMILALISSSLKDALVQVGNYLLSWMTPLWISVYLAVAIIPPILLIASKRHLRGTPELNAKYHSFARIDYPHWSYWKMPLLNIVSLFPVRLVIAISIKVIYITIAQFALCGSKPGEPLSKWRTNILKFVRFLLSRLHWMACGVISVTKVVPNVDYSKYMGPDWSPTYTKSGLQVANHTSWLDVVASMYLECPSFVAKYEISRIPVIAQVANSI